MNTIQSVLVGVDFSNCSRVALKQAARLADQWNVKLHALHALEYLTLDDEDWSRHVPQDRLNQEAVSRMSTTLHQWLAEEAGEHKVTVHVKLGNPLDIILNQLLLTKANLLVLGVSGSAMIPIGAGMLATKCSRKSPVHVLLVHERQTRPFRKIVVGVDFSDQSREAVAQALLMAELEESELHLVHVFTGSWGSHALVADTWEMDAERVAHYRQALQDRLRGFAKPSKGTPAQEPKDAAI